MRDETACAASAGTEWKMRNATCSSATPGVYRAEGQKHCYRNSLFLLRQLLWKAMRWEDYDRGYCSE